MEQYAQNLQVEVLKKFEQLLPFVFFQAFFKKVSTTSFMTQKLEHWLDQRLYSLLSDFLEKMSTEGTSD